MSEIPGVLLISEGHRRFENGVMTRDEYAYRTIVLRFLDEMDKLIISINPTLTEKLAFAKGKVDEYLFYQGQDPDYEFLIKLNHVTKTIDEVILVRLDKGFELRYSTRLPAKGEIIIKGV